MRHEVGPRSLSALRQLLVDVRRRGYAVEEGEVTPGFSSVAASVLDHSAHPVAAVAVTYPEREVDPAQGRSLQATVTKAAEDLGRRLRG
jgi:DNA-binding IclR family transcriptional regulator